MTRPEGAARLKHMLLNELEKVVNLYPELEFNLYLEFNRRFEVVKRLARHLPSGARVCELGAQPFILSAMIKLLGYNVIAVDIEPERYINIARSFNIPVVKSDLERDRLPINDESCDCVVFSEVLEHLNPYYVPHTLYEINRILRKGGLLLLTTPNIASLFRRLKLLLGRQPLYRYHVKEYTIDEVRSLLSDNGFEVIELSYSEVNDRSFLLPRDKRETRKLVEVESYVDMLKFTAKNINWVNMLRVIAYPIVKIAPSTRMLIIAVARKAASTGRVKSTARWG